MPSRHIPYLRRQVVQWYKKGNSYKRICSLLRKTEGIQIKRHQVGKVVRRWLPRNANYKEIAHGRKKLFGEDRVLVGNYLDFCLHADNELTTAAIQARIKVDLKINVDICTLKRIRREWDWLEGATRYGHSVREPNRAKRVQFAQWIVDSQEQFKSHVFTDETTVQLEPNRRRCFFKAGDKKMLIKGKVKHPLKVHVWGGISWQGATSVVIFDGKHKMDSPLFVRILKHGYVPHVQKCYPNEDCLLVMDNDPKHRSAYTVAEMAKMGGSVQCLDWPSESPDLNPIEIVWGNMKANLRKQKLMSKEALIAAIKKWWKEHLTVDQCRRYIHHINTVAPIVIECNGGTTKAYRPEMKCVVQFTPSKGYQFGSVAVIDSSQIKDFNSKLKPGNFIYVSYEDAEYSGIIRAMDDKVTKTLNETLDRITEEIGQRYATQPLGPTAKSQPTTGKKTGKKSKPPPLTLKQKDAIDAANKDAISSLQTNMSDRLDVITAQLAQLIPNVPDTRDKTPEAHPEPDWTFPSGLSKHQFESTTSESEKANARALAQRLYKAVFRFEGDYISSTSCSSLRGLGAEKIAWIKSVVMWYFQIDFKVWSDCMKAMDSQRRNLAAAKRAHPAWRLLYCAQQNRIVWDKEGGVVAPIAQQHDDTIGQAVIVATISEDFDADQYLNHDVIVD